MISPIEASKDVQAIRRLLAKRTKPWSARMIPKVYNWKSSLADKWVEIYGPNCFQKAENPEVFRVNAHKLNNCREFLHTLTHVKLKTVQDEEKRDLMTSRKIKLSQISKGVDLIGQNLYIKEKISILRARSQNSTPIKRKAL
jgi:hypothetical protein